MASKHGIVLGLVLLANCLERDPNPGSTFNCENDYTMTLVQSGEPRTLPNLCDGGARGQVWDLSAYSVTLHLEQPNIEQAVKQMEDQPGLAQISLSAGEDAALGMYRVLLEVERQRGCAQDCNRTYNLNLQIVDAPTVGEFELSLTAKSVRQGTVLVSDAQIDLADAAELTAFVQGGEEPYTYLWSAVPLIARAGLEIPQPSEVSPGAVIAEPPEGEPVVYRVIVRDNLGSEARASFLLQRVGQATEIIGPPVPESIHYGDAVELECVNPDPDQFTCLWYLQFGQAVDPETERALLSGAEAQAAHAWEDRGRIGNDGGRLVISKEAPLGTDTVGIYRLVLRLVNADNQFETRAQATRVFARRY